MSFEVAALAANLQPKTGKRAVENRYRSQVEATQGVHFTHSVDVDAHFRDVEPNANRWDYGIGVRQGTTHFAIWVEPHGATSSSEVDKVLAKLSWLKGKLRLQQWAQLRALTEAAKHHGIQQFWWLVPGTVCFRPGSTEEKKLAQFGMKMPTKKVEIR